MATTNKTTNKTTNTTTTATTRRRRSTKPAAAVAATATTTTTTTETAAPAVVAVPLNELTTSTTIEVIKASIESVDNAETLVNVWNKFAKANKSDLFKSALSPAQLSAVQAFVAEREAKEAAAKEAERKAIEAAKERAAKAAEEQAERVAAESEKRLNDAIANYFELQAESSEGLPRILSTSYALSAFDYPEYIVIRGKTTVSASGVEKHKTLLLPIDGFRSSLTVVKQLFKWFASAQIVCDANKTVLRDETGAAYHETITKRDGTTITKAVTIGGANPFRPFMQAYSLEFLDSETGDITRITCEDTFGKTSLRDAASAIRALKAARTNRGRKILWGQIVETFMGSCHLLRAVRRYCKTVCE